MVSIILISNAEISGAFFLRPLNLFVGISPIF